MGPAGPDRTGTEKGSSLPDVSPHPVRAEPRVLYSPVSGGFMQVLYEHPLVVPHSRHT